MESDMNTWLDLQRLDYNNLDMPKYGTQASAAFDFSACLTRQCFKVSNFNNVIDKVGFYTTDLGLRSYDKQIMQSDPVLKIDPNEVVMVSLGFKCEFNNDHVLKIYIRSSTSLSGLMLANGVGIIDADYRGELYACLYNRSISPVTILHGQRIVQGVILPISKPIINEKIDLAVTSRTGGFGSTGL